MEYQDIINPAELVPMDIFTETAPLRVDLAYAGPHSFCGVIYRKDTRLWLHRDLAAVVLRAARQCHEKYMVSMVLYDGLRTVTAQQAMLESEIVRAHAHWLEGGSRVLSPPGHGGHPRGMAVDAGLIAADGTLLDMGTAFDELPEGGSGPDVNRAHRDYADLPPAVKENRRILTGAMTDAAQSLDLPLLPLPVEWWDFRFPKDVWGRYAPLSDTDLPPQMRMTDRHMDFDGPPDFPSSHFDRLKEELLQLL